MKYANIHLTDSTATFYTECEHSTGWYVRVKFLFFSKYVFICSDCGEVIYKKKIKERK